MELKSLRVLLPLLLLTPATMTLAQDSTSPSPVTKRARPAVRTSPAKSPVRSLSSQRIRIRTIKGQLGDLEARRVASDAERVRKRAACMLAAADEMDKSAKRLDKVADAGREKAQDDVEDAALLVEDCEYEKDESATGAIPEVRTKISGASASTACAKDRADCNKAFGKSAWSKLLADSRNDFRSCYENSLYDRSHLEGLTRFMVRMGSGDTEGAVEKLRIEKDTVDDDAMLECQAEVVRSMDFPEAADGKTLRFTLHHAPLPPKALPPKAK